jgi:phosphoglycolate phosphatase-like HAD superfamily hydrolase
MVRHIVWDWNGTLFDDQELVLAATNASLLQAGRALPITGAQYQDAYRRPMEEFYADFLGYRPTAEQWPAIDRAFEQSYEGGVHACGLNPDALEAMDAWSPRSQSLLSMYGHDRLLEVTARFELHGRLARIDGRPPDPDFGPKAKYLVRHFEHLRVADPALTPDQLVMIGDCVDDADAARAIGASAVLYTGGSSSRAVLEKAGVPVVGRLSEAVELIAARAL